MKLHLREVGGGLALSVLGALTAMGALSACSEEPTPTHSFDEVTAGKVAEAKARALVDEGFRYDERISLLLAPCAKGGYYDRDTGDTLAILIDKLLTGSSDALHRAKEELADLGEPAAREVARVLNRHFDEPMGGAKVQNCIEVLGLMRGDAAHEPLIKCLDHPRDSVRGATLRALANGAARPEDFERLLAHIPVEREHMRQQAAVALFTADPDRAATTFLGWLEIGQYQDLWPFLANKLPEADPTLIRAKALELCDQIDPSIGLPLAAIALPLGDPRPQALLDKYLASENGAQRLPAVNALLRAGYLEEVADFATDDPDSVIRSLVLAGLADGTDPEAGPTTSTLERFLAGLDDPAPEVRKLTIGVLLAWKDPRAADRALAMLGGGRQDLQEIVLTLIGPLSAQPELATRVFERIAEIDAKSAALPLAQRLGVLQAMGQVPKSEAAAYLLDLARKTTGELQGLRAHRWLMIQASNTGHAGRMYLASKLAEETLPENRLDMIWAISSQRDETSRAFLLDFLQTDAEPYELLFAADRMARTGPTAVAAPVLKRMTLRVEHPEVRRALECVLWRWY